MSNKGSVAVAAGGTGGHLFPAAALSHALAARGFTVHLVTDDLDAGPILVQETVPVLEDDTVAVLHQRIHEAEYRILPEAIRLMEARLAKSPAVG